MDDNSNKDNNENPELPKHIIDGIKSQEKIGKMITAYEKELRSEF
jgi:hypothetical protein